MSSQFKLSSGNGFQLEVRLAYPLPHTVQQALVSHGVDSTTAVTLAQAKALCETLDAPELAHQISPESAAGCGLFHILQANGTTTAEFFMEWFLMQRSTVRLREHIKAVFHDGHALLEQHEQTFRFSLSAGEHLSLGVIFRTIEEAREGLQIVEYTVSQTSLEQVFNGFAAQQQEETGPVRGFN